MIGDNKLHKLKKKILEDKQELESELQTPPPTSVFKQELEKAELEAEKKKEQDDVKPKLLL
jgi:hypothetical protein